MELLDKKIIAKYIDSKYRSYLDNMIIFDELSSTNTYLAEQAKINNNSINICLAESQTNGKGRLGREWFSPFAQNIYLSLLWRLTKKSQELSSLSLAIAVAVVEALKNYGIKDDIFLKWPNDVLWQKHKIAGILIDLVNGYAVIGVGLNVNMQKADQIEQPWCSVAQIMKAIPERNKLTAFLLNELLKTMVEYQQHGLKSFIKKWRQLDVTYGKKVTIIMPQNKIIGIGAGINSKGHFLLKDANNKIQAFTTGEISLRF